MGLKSLVVLTGKVAVSLYFICFLGWVLYAQMINAPVAALKQPELEGEMAQIPVPAGTTVVESRALHNTESATVTKTFKLRLTRQQVKQYYDRELARNGWIFVSEKKLFDWGRDLGGEAVIYCKNSYEASLTFAGSNANDAWDCAFSLIWRMSTFFGRGTGCHQ